MSTHSLAEVAALHVPPEIKNPIRWLRERLNRKEIPGKQLTRGVWVMTDADIEKWINTRAETPTATEDTQPEVVSIADGLSQRARRRIESDRATA